MVERKWHTRSQWLPYGGESVLLIDPRDRVVAAARKAAAGGDGRKATRKKVGRKTSGGRQSTQEKVGRKKGAEKKGTGPRPRGS